MWCWCWAWSLLPPVTADMTEQDRDDDYISKTRDRVVEELNAEGGGRVYSRDINITIKTIQALISTNTQIITHLRKHVLNEICLDGCDCNATMDFIKNDYSTVKVWNLNGITQVVVWKEVVNNSFHVEPLIIFPDECLKLFEVKRDQFGFIDFNSYLNTSLMLHDDILVPFLEKLRDHLEHVQVCLGKIDEWLMKSENNVSFLKTIFGVDANMIPMTTSQSTWCRCRDHHYYEQCGNCGATFKNHTPDLDSARQCPHKYRNTIFCCKQEFRVLAEFNMDERHEASFDINQGHERGRFLRFTEYLKFQYKSYIYSVFKCNDKNNDGNNEGYDQDGNQDRSHPKKRLKSG